MTQHDSANGHFIVNDPTTLSKDKKDTISAASSGNHDTEKQVSNSQSTAKKSAYASLGWLDRLLALWILLAIIIGIVIGNFAPGAEAALQRGKFVQVSVPVAVGLLVMMYPIMCKVKFETLHRVFSTREVWRQLLFSVIMNWLVAPFLMVCTFHPFVQQPRVRNHAKPIYGSEPRLPEHAFCGHHADMLNSSD